jgi:hypothetical protein
LNGSVTKLLPTYAEIVVGDMTAVSVDLCAAVLRVVLALTKGAAPLAGISGRDIG